MGPIGWSRRRFGSDDAAEPQPSPDALAAPETPGVLLREGELVELRRHIPSNQAAFQRWYADPEITAMLRHDQKPLNAIQSRGYFQTVILPLTARDMAYAIHEKATGRLIGASALTDISGRQQKHAFFRIVIGEKSFWGQGYGTEATRLVVLDGFERHHLDEVRLEVFLENERARAAYDRVGFIVTGEHSEFAGRGRPPLDVIEMAIVREDFDDALAEELARREEERAAAALAAAAAAVNGEIDGADAGILDTVNGEPGSLEPEPDAVNGEPAVDAPPPATPDPNDHPAEAELPARDSRLMPGPPG